MPLVLDKVSDAKFEDDIMDGDDGKPPPRPVNDEHLSFDSDDEDQPQPDSDAQSTGNDRLNSSLNALRVRSNTC